MPSELILNDTTSYWERQVAAAWRETIDGIFHIGVVLRHASEDECCRFEDMHLPFGQRTAQRLIAVSRNEWLTAHGSLLPASWRTLYALNELTEDELEAHLALGDITPELERSTVEGWKKKRRRAERERELAEKVTAVVGCYGVIYADPPWRFEPYSRETGMDRAADNHYPTMDLEAIKELEVPAAEDCVLFLWATVPMLPQAIEVMQAWGFEYKSHFVWAKNRIGNGYWNRNCHELLLIGTCGDVPAPAPGDQYASVIQASVAEHSVKPFHFREIIEDMFPNLPRIELFARERFDGWAYWGNEVSDAA